jgi:predicted enzyme related to lactoylglutathione lyase
MAGQLVHFEIPAQDTARAKGFYADLFGWKFESYEGPMEYHMTQAGGDPGGGLYPAQSSEKGPIVYFDVDDMDAAVARVRELGGEAEDKHPIPSIGWFARCKDTEGNTFSLFKSDESAQAPA